MPAPQLHQLCNLKQMHNQHKCHAMPRLRGSTYSPAGKFSTSGQTIDTSDGLTRLLQSRLTALCCSRPSSLLLHLLLPRLLLLLLLLPLLLLLQLPLLLPRWQSNFSECHGRLHAPCSRS